MYELQGPISNHVTYLLDFVSGLGFEKTDLTILERLVAFLTS